MFDVDELGGSPGSRLRAPGLPSAHVAELVWRSFAASGVRPDGVGVLGAAVGRRGGGSLPPGVCGVPFGVSRAYGEGMWAVIIILLVVWAILSIVGFAFKGLLWLAIIGIVLFLGTAVFGFVRRSVSRK